MSSEQTDRTDLIFKALASKPRRDILTLLATGDAADSARCCTAEEVCACDFAEKLGLGAPTVSHHMKALIEAGLDHVEQARAVGVLPARARGLRARSRAGAALRPAGRWLQLRHLVGAGHERPDIGLSL